MNPPALRYGVFDKTMGRWFDEALVGAGRRRAAQEAGLDPACAKCQLEFKTPVWVLERVAEQLAQPAEPVTGRLGV